MTEIVVPIKKRKQIIQSVKCKVIRRVAAPKPESVMQKNKNAVTENFKIGLHVIIYRAEGIDAPTNHPSVTNRDYNVVYWIKPGEEIHTKIVKDAVIPEWKQENVLMLDSLDDEMILNVEVQRSNSLIDPGTSGGEVVVGRVKIPLPDVFNRPKVGSYHLLRSDGKGHRLEGNISLSMRLQRIRPDSAANSWFYTDDIFSDDDVMA